MHIYIYIYIEHMHARAGRQTSLRLSLFSHFLSPLLSLRPPSPPPRHPLPPPPPTPLRGLTRRRPA